MKRDLYFVKEWACVSVCVCEIESERVSVCVWLGKKEGKVEEIGEPIGVERCD